MSTQEIQLPRSITNQLLHLAIQNPEHEVCGLIGAKDGIASSFHPITNTAEQPETRYQLDEKQQINALANIRNNNESLFAIFHSHPSSPATPSSIDIEMANYPEAIQLIISLNTKGILEIRAFKIINKVVEEITLSLLSD